MKFAYSNKQMREADANTIAGGIPSFTLMERAGGALAQAVESAMRAQGIDEALFVCGGGNNGGDGFVAARILFERGKEVNVLCLADRFSEDCALAKAKYGGEIFGRIPRRRFALVVDCLFGTGLSRAPEGDGKFLIEFINSCGAYVIACDLPSGLSESGIAYEPCVAANEMVAVGGLKQALLFADGADVCGKITVADIGIVFSEPGAEVWERKDVARYFPRKKSNSHKGDYGNACILGGEAVSGAAFLAVGACLKSGAGYTRLFVPPAVYSAAIGKNPSCILQSFADVEENILASDAIAFGFGAGTGEWAYDIVKKLLKSFCGTLVLDADALNSIARFGREVLKEKKCSVILTPHPKEFSRLTGIAVSDILKDPVRHAREFARDYRVTVLFKNNRSVITDGERVAINLTGSPVLAKGGSGDMLAGYLAGTAARGISPYEAACCSAYVCGKAGEAAANEWGEYAPDAQDVISRIPYIMRDIIH